MFRKTLHGTLLAFLGRINCSVRAKVLEMLDALSRAELLEEPLLADLRNDGFDALARQILLTVRAHLETFLELFEALSCAELSNVGPETDTVLP